MTDEAPTVVTDPRQAWLIKRRSVITGTDLAALFGVGYKGASDMKVWLDKTGREPAMEDNDAFRFGRRFERPVLEEYAEQEQVNLIFADSHHLGTNPKYPFIGATLDATRADNGHPVDAKNLGFKSPEFGADGSDVMPLKYMLQLTAQMMVTDAEAAALAVLFNRYEFCRYPMQRDPIVVERICERAERFMVDHVQADTPPPVDGSESWTAWLGKHFRQQNKTILTASPEDHEFAVALHTTKQQIKTLEEEADGLANRLKLSIGEAYGMEGPEWRITWAQAKDKVTIDWGAAFIELSQLVGAQVAKETLDGIVATYTSSKPGSRSFRLTFREETPAS